MILRQDRPGLTLIGVDRRVFRRKYFYGLPVKAQPRVLKGNVKYAVRISGQMFQIRFSYFFIKKIT